MLAATPEVLASALLLYRVGRREKRSTSGFAFAGSQGQAPTLRIDRETVPP